MTTLTWNQAGERRFETGVDRGVLYPTGAVGVAWSGLTSVKETPAGGESTPYYVDGIKYIDVASPEEFEGTIEAYTYPLEFEACDGTASVLPGLSFGQQTRVPFGLSYRTLLGNDLESVDYGYKIHFIYGALASPTERANETNSEDPEPVVFSWNFTTTPVFAGSGYKPVAHVSVDSTKLSDAAMRAIEEFIYGTDTTPPALPTPEELVVLCNTTDDLIVDILVDGLYAVEGDGVSAPDPSGVFAIDHDNVVDHGDGTFEIL